MYTPVLFAAQMGLGWMRGITTCPSMNPYLQKKQQRLATCEAVTVSHPIPTCHAAQRFIKLTLKGCLRFQPVSYVKSKNNSRGSVRGIKADRNKVISLRGSIKLFFF